MNNVRVLIADDTKMIRDGLRALLESAGGVEVVGEATGGAEALRLARELDPDVVVMDVRMPDMDGVRATRELKAAGVAAPVVAISAALDDFTAGRLREAGVFALVPKEDAFERLVPAVRAAAAEGRPARGAPRAEPRVEPPAAPPGRPARATARGGRPRQR
jgi:DNA-binding NarL/FixJ family response regulator